MKSHKSLVVVFGVLWSLLTVCQAAPQKQLWPKWEANQPESKQIISHQAFQHFLSHYVYQGPKGNNLLHYSKVTANDKHALHTYINTLSTVPISQYNRKEQLAYWINLYNALTIDLILKNWPVESITKLNISPGLFSYGPWDARLVQVENEPITLNDIEHRILRPIWQDPRLHYALNCASISCPPIRNKAFTGENADTMLTDAAREYVNSTFGVEADGKVLKISKIYQWYQSDFGISEQDMLLHLERYAHPKLKEKLQNKDKKIQYQYNWQVNGD